MPWVTGSGRNSRYGLSKGSLDAAEIVADFDVERFPAGDIALLTWPVEPRRWLDTVPERYAFATGLDGTERKFARCNPDDRRK